jgi:hypothetical protein
MAVCSACAATGDAGAKALGLMIPNQMQLLADDVIE